LKWQKDNLYRCRIWKIRIIFLKGEKKWFIKGIGYRWNVYKN
jgi:hypothetical protein